MAKVFIKVSFFILVLAPIVIGAQFNLSQSFTPNYADELTMELIPTYPEPGERVTINLKMYTENLASSEISWYQDDQKVSNGIGQTSFSFTAPASGQTSIHVEIKTLSGISFSKTILVNPASVDLIWEASSYTPPFYKGKALFPPQGAVKILAMPNFKSNGLSVSPARLIYNWTINGEVDQNQSGYGKNIVFVNGSLLGRPVEVELLATDPATNLTANNFMVINTAEPEIIFYENNPLYGIIFEKAVKEMDLTGNETSVVAAPYNLSVSPIEEISYSWRVNNALAPEVFGRLATFKKPEGVGGSSLVSLSIENQSRILQSAKQSFLINFNNNESSGF